MRNKGIDLVKTIAILFVVVVHLYGEGLSYEMASSQWTWSLFWGCMARAAVPLFFMCSGAIFMDRSRDLPLKKLYGKYIPRILAAMFFWSFLYKIYFLSKQGIMSADTLIHSAKEVLLLNQNFHFYYLHMILLFYALLPIVKTFLKSADRRATEYALVIWFLTGILYPTVQTFWPFKLLFGIPRQWLLNMTYASIGYGLLGHYIREYRISPKLWGLSWLIGFGFTFIGTYHMTMKEGELYKVFLEGMSLGPALMAAGAFGLCMHLGKNIKGTGEKIISYVSRSSFCVYLLHMMCVYFLEDNDITLLAAHTSYSIPLYSLMVVIICMGCYFLLSHVPVVKKWLV